ncbi:hypothetical protein HYV82_00135 [Candidatus Woesearchaeota archaeon]|nr:hypothetical protein [Candidatus Woesearchaeota archaeon]
MGIKQAVKGRSKELIIFAIGLPFGLLDSFVHKERLGLELYLTNGLPLAGAAILGAYIKSTDAVESITRIGAPLYVGHLAGETIGELVKRQYMY